MSVNKKKSSNIVMMLAAAVFLLMGTVNIISGIYLNIQISSSREVKAQIVDIAEKSKRKRRIVGYDNVTVYAPVYEYSDNGKTMIYKSTVYSSDFPRLGSSGTLYILKNGSVTDKANANSQLALGISGIFMGGLLIFICIKPPRKNTDAGYLSEARD